MAQDTTQALPLLKPEKKAAARVYRGDDVMPPQVEVGDVPEGAVMMLHNGDWCDKAAALLVLEAEGNRARQKAVGGAHGDPAGASARERMLEEMYRLLAADNMAAISQKLFGHKKAKWFRLSNLAHPEVKRIGPDGEPVAAKVNWAADTSKPEA